MEALWGLSSTERPHYSKLISYTAYTGLCATTFWVLYIFQNRFGQSQIPVNPTDIPKTNYTITNHYNYTIWALRIPLYDIWTA